MIRPYRSLNATVAQNKNDPFGVTTTTEPKNTATSHNNGVWRGMFWLRSLPVLSDAFVIFFSSIVVLTPNGSLRVVLLLHSVSDITKQNIYAEKCLYLSDRWSGQMIKEKELWYIDYYNLINLQIAVYAISGLFPMTMFTLTILKSETNLWLCITFLVPKRLSVFLIEKSSCMFAYSAPWTQTDRQADGDEVNLTFSPSPQV